MFNNRLISKMLVIIITLFLLLAGCSAEPEAPNYDILTGMTQSTKIESIKTLDDVIQASDFIVLGTLTKIESFKTGEILYSIQIEQQLKGHSDIEGQVIDVASQVKLSNENEKYLLFLDYIDSERFQSPIYTSIIHSNPIITDTFTEGAFKEKSVTKIIKLVSESAQINNYTSYPRVIIEEASSLEVLYTLSDYIVHIKPKSSINENSRVKLVLFDLIQKYKGDENIMDRQYVILPSEIELDQEYIVFFNSIEEEGSDVPTLKLSTRVGSIIAKNNEDQWNTVIEMLRVVK